MEIGLFSQLVYFDGIALIKTALHCGVFAICLYYLFAIQKSDYYTIDDIVMSNVIVKVKATEFSKDS